jgi:glycosyltransferase involved in cell wall biosynthesis
MHPIDLIISGNDAIEKEDYRTKLVIDRMTGTVPIVYDCQDFLSDCFDRDLKGKVIERFVNENADAVIHTNPVGFDWIASKYKIRRGFVFSNFTSQKYFVNKQPKLSDRDGRTHLVYCGGVQQTPGGSLYPVARDMRRMFTNIAKLGFPLHLHLGLYPETSLCQYYMTLRDSPNIIMHPYLPYEDMMQTLSRYDIGLFPVDLGPLQKELERIGPGAMEYSPLSRIDTSKQYEYTMAGLPVLSRPVKWISAWLEGNGFGTHFISVSHLGELLRGKDLQGFAQSVARNARKFSIENQIEELEDFLFDVLGESRKKSKGKMKG